MLIVVDNGASVQRLSKDLFFMSWFEIISVVILGVVFTRFGRHISTSVSELLECQWAQLV